MTVVDLAQERRIRDLTEDLRQKLMDSPELARRTDAMLRGQLPAPDLEEEMAPNDVQFSVRVPEDLVKRLDKMEARMAKDPEWAAFRVSRQAVLRAALMRGLDVMEAEQAAKRVTK